MKKILLLFTLLAGGVFQVNAALVTYNGGGAAGVWNDAANWDSGAVPTAADDVVISGSSNSVTLSITATVQSVEIKSGATLTIAAAGILNLGNDDGGGTNGALDLDSTSGEVINNGTINVTNAAENGIHVKGTLTNNGIISVDGGINGIYSTAGGTIDNAGMITVTNATLYYIQVDDGTTGGVLLTSTFNNTGTVTVNMTTPDDDDGIYVNDGSTFNNNAAGVVNVNNDGGDDGIRLADSSTFKNNAGGTVNYTFTSASTGTSNAISTGTSSLFDNCGDLNIDGSGNDAIAIASGTTFDNSGSVLIENSGDHGLELKGTLVNSGTYKDVNSDGDAVRVESSGNFSNTGTLIIDITSITSDAIENKGTFSSTGIIETGCLDTANELEINNGDLDLGTSCVNFDIGGTSSSVYDQLQPKASNLTVTNATAKLDFGTFVPSVGNCFTIINGDSNGTGVIVGSFATVTCTSPTAAITCNVELDDPDIPGTITELKVCILSVVLPVELTYFEGKIDNAASYLSWETQAEESNDYFEVQYSTDGREFSTIGMVDGNGTTSEVQNYGYTHKDVKSTDNYYRLKQVDFDGDFEYSDIIYLKNNVSDTPVAIYPNPARELVTYDGEAAILTFFDIQGRQVMQQPANERTTIDISTLKSGVYTIEILTNTGNRIFEKLIKK